MNSIALTDSKLTALYRQVTFEIGRRTKVATNGHDAAAIIKGQEMGKRAVVVAAAGKHSLHLFGAASSGKTMLRAVARELGLAETCATLFSNNPYETVNPPNPDGGFHSQQEVWING